MQHVSLDTPYRQMHFQDSDNSITQAMDAVQPSSTAGRSSRALLKMEAQGSSAIHGDLLGAQPAEVSCPQLTLHVVGAVMSKGGDWHLPNCGMMGCTSGDYVRTVRGYDGCRQPVLHAMASVMSCGKVESRLHAFLPSGEGYCASWSC